MMDNYTSRYRAKIAFALRATILLCLPIMAAGQAQGPLFPSSEGTIAATGTATWSNIGRVETDNNFYTTSSLSSNQTSRILYTQDYGFSIPAAATITGIEVSIERLCSSTTGGNSVRDVSLRLIKNNFIVGNDYAGTATDWTTSNTVVTYGGATDLWGQTWTPADINATNFGATFSVRAENSARTAYVDYIAIKVYYSAGPSISGFSQTSACAGTTPSVTITGTNFTGASTVTFNGTPSAFTVGSSTQITATLPAAATTGQISVTTPNGTATTAALSPSVFTVTPLPSVNPITGTMAACVSSTTTLSESTPGGVWSTSTPALASVSASGVVTGIAPGTAIIIYTVNQSGCAASVSAGVQINASPATSGPSQVCLGDTAQLTPTTGGTWVSNNPSVATIDNAGNITTVSAGTTTFTFTDSVTTCSATTATFTVGSAPSISLSPISQSACSGSAVSFSAPATGLGLTYQWFNGASPMANGGNISGADTATLTISPVSVADASADYHCVVTGTCAPAATSASAALTVSDPVVINSQPSAAQTVCEGQPATFTVSATGTSLTYQWFRSGNPLADGGNLSGATSPTLTISPVAASDQASDYYCQITAAAPCGSIPSSLAALTVNQAPAISIEPVSTQSVCDQDTVSVAVAASGGSLSYQWFDGAMPLSDGGRISGAQSNILTFSPVTVADAGTNYHCVVSNSCTSVSSLDAEIIVGERPAIPAQAASVCSDGTFSVTPVNGTPDAATIVPAGTTYSWAAPVVTGGLSGGVAGSGQNTISGTLHNPTDVAQTATYTVTPTSGTAGSCMGNPFTVTVTVQPVPSIINQSSQICSGQSVSIIPATGGGNIVPAGTTYSWGMPSVTGGLTGATTGTGQSSFMQALVNLTGSAQTASYNVTAAYGTCVGATFTVTVTVQPKPDVALAPLTQTICSGDPVSTITISNPNGVTGVTSYTWTRDNTVNVTGMAASGSGTSIAGSLANATGSPQTVNFTVYAVSEEGCLSDPTTATVTVYPMPVPQASVGTQTVCSGSAITTVNFGTSNSIAGTAFTWTRDNTANLTGIAASGAGTGVSGTLVNTTNTVQTTTFTLTGTATGCIGTTTFSVTVKPQPSVNAAPSAQTLCGSAGMTTIVFSNPNNVLGTSFTWTRDNVAAVTGIAASGSGSGISGTPVNTTGSNQTVTFTISASAGGCSSTTTATMTVMPTPQIVATPATQSICNATAITSIVLSTSNSLAGTTYAWTRTNTANITGIAANGSGNISGTLTNATSSNQTTLFTITATAPNGCTKTITASVTVYPALTAPVIIDAQTVCAGSRPTPLTSSVAVGGGSGTYTYQWQSASSASGPWTNLSGATSNSYWPPTTSTATPTTFYHMVVSNACGSVTSNAVSVAVVNNVNFSFSVSGGGTTVCPGETFTVGIASGQILPDSYIKYSYVGDLNYLSPNSGGPAGTTTVYYFLGFPLFAISSANFTMTAVNNTTADVTTSIFVTPSIYDVDTNALICSLSPRQVNITIRPKPVATVIAPAAGSTICSANSAGVTVSSNITGTTTSYVITRSANANVTSSAGFPINSGNVASGGTYTINDVLTNNSTATQAVTYSITPSANGCTGTATTFTVNIAPKLTAGTIAANQVVCYGSDPVAFTQTAATGAGTLTYQWQSSTASAAGPFTDIAGATSATYDVPPGLVQTTWYTRVVTSTFNGVPCSVATTTPVQVTVNNVNAGTLSGSQTICSGSGATITGTAGTGTGSITYQWESNTTGCGGAWATIPGQTGQNLTVSGLTQTTYYRRTTISTASGSPCSDASNCVVITVNNVTGGTVGSDQVLCGNNPSLFTVIAPSTASGVISYQWQSNTTGCAGSWTSISGATGATYDAPPGVVATTYYRRVTTSLLNGVSCSANSNCITVTPNSVTGGTISGNRTVCSGGDPAAFTETVAAIGSGLTYQWQVSTTGSAPWADIPGATGITYDAPGPAAQTLYYQRVAYATVGATTCSAASNFVTVFVNDVTAPAYSGDQSVCSEDPAAFSVSTPATGSGTLSYQWQKSMVDCSTGWSNIIGANAAVYDPPVVSATTYYRVLATSTLNGVSCTAIGNCLTITSMAKTWNGSVSSDWATAANWTPAGVPTASHCVVIPNVAVHAIVPGGGYLANAYSVTVWSGGHLEISPSGSLTVVDKVTVNGGGLLEVQDKANLVQVNGVADTGIVTVRRITQPMYKFDYTYWNSPMTLASNYTLGMLSQNLTQYDKYYSWNPSVAGGAGNWVQESAATVMSPSKGYIVRAPNTFSSNPAVTQPYTATFVGTPNNGDVNIPISIGGLGAGTSNDKMNLIGNPYPSAVSALAFVNDPANAGLMQGTIYFWTHHAPPSAAFANPFYGSFVYNYSPSGYASLNALGGTNTVPSGYGGPAPNDNIASGQGFFVEGKASGTAVFRNSMRTTGDNGAFFRSANPYVAQPTVFESHRIWLNMADTQGSFSQALVGYADGATDGFDRNFDGKIFASGISLYSMVDGQPLGIQGFALPFEETDVIPLGYTSTVAREFTIGIDHLDGIFSDHAVFLADKQLDIVHDLRESAYTFSTLPGQFNDRFELRFTDAALGNHHVSMAGAAAYFDGPKLIVRSKKDIVSIAVFDLTGKLLERRDVAPTTALAEDIDLPKSVYLLRITFADGSSSGLKLPRK